MLPVEPAMAPPPKRRLFSRPMLVLWPSFAMASVMEGLVFAAVDPDRWIAMHPQLQAWTPSTLYSIAFLVFWAIIATAGFFTRILESTVDAVDDSGANPS
jgi:hypothetical protein